MSESEDLNVEQVVQICIHDLISQFDDHFQISAKRVIEKNAELYRRLAWLREE